MAVDDRELTANRFEEAARELAAGGRHAEVASQHFRSHDVPRGCAHAWAARGHLLKAAALLDENAVLHSTKAVAVG